MIKVPDFSHIPPKKGVADSEGLFALMAEGLSDGFFLWDQEGNLVFVNRKLGELFGGSGEQLVGRSVFDLVDDENRKILIKQTESLREGIQKSYEIEWLGERGQKIHTVVLATPLLDGTGVFRGAFAILTDIGSGSEGKKREDLSFVASVSVSGLSGEKTEKHEEKVFDQQQKIANRHTVEKSLIMMEDVLVQKNMELQETKAALYDLLCQGSDAIAELERKIFSNLQQMVFPYLKKMEQHNKDEQSLLLINVIRANLEKISSSFSQKLSSRLRGVTPREVEVAEFIKLGKTTKEISNLLDISPRTVESYRDSLRIKLNIKHKKINLRTHLATDV